MEFLIASRRERPGNDPIFALNAEAKQRIGAGEDVVNATIGALLDDDGRLATMPGVVRALQEVEPRVGAAYAPIPGRPDFRQAVIDDLLTGSPLHEVSVAVATPGGSGALRMSMDDFLEPGQTALTGSYYWGPYRTLADESGRRLTTFEMFGDDGRFDVAALDRSLGEVMAEQGRCLLILNTPCHNPTGYSLDAAEWAATQDVLRRHARSGPLVVLLDVAYAYYAEEALEVAVRALHGVADEVLVLFAWSASKSFAQYGLRIGALVASVPDAGQRQAVNNAMTYSCRGLWSNCNAGGQAAIARVLTDAALRQQVNVERAGLVAMLARRVDTWNELAGDKPHIVYPRYQGGFFTTVFCDDPQEKAAALRERGIYVIPTRGALRVAMCAVNDQQIARIVSGLDDVFT
ncbi:MAG: aminotransferase class I/II-fold pyridoxal phosphate-dependent enzyme [Myxococcota bacterium]